MSQTIGVNSQSRVKIKIVGKELKFKNDQSSGFMFTLSLCKT